VSTREPPIYSSVDKRGELLRLVRSHPAVLAACGFGSGLAPKAPGTFGTLCAALLYLALRTLPTVPYVLVVMAAFVLGIWLCGYTARALEVHDHPAIVWDEFVGYWITMVFAPRGWIWIAAGFAAFRLFDIWKPWPIRVLDRRVEGGLGIMIDDAVAGIYAAASLQVLILVTI